MFPPELNRNLLGYLSNNEECLVIKTCSDVELNSHSQEAYCRNDAGFVNYLSFHYCTLEKQPVISVILIVMKFNLKKI